MTYYSARELSTLAYLETCTDCGVHALCVHWQMAHTSRYNPHGRRTKLLQVVL